MGAGDPVEDLTTGISGGGTSTVSIPSGEVWVVSSLSAGGEGGTPGLLLRTDGMNDTESSLTGDSTRAVSNALRPVFDSHDPKYENTGCSSANYGLSGRQI